MTNEEEVKRSFHVEIERVQTHMFVVEDVNSQEEAEMIAAEWLEDGEDGSVLTEEVINVDSYPTEDEEDYN